jgi:methyl-accepting chemotaxis protein
VIFLATHAACACVASFAAAVAVLSGHAGWGLLLTFLITLLLSLIAAAWLATRVRAGLHLVVRAATEGESARERSVGIEEFDRTAQRVGELAQRWKEVAADSQEQAREISLMLHALDRRSGGDPRPRREAGARQLRHILGGIARKIDEDLSKVVHCSRDIAQASSEIASDAEQQSGAVTKTTTYVEQMSTNLDAVSKSAESAEVCVRGVHDSAREIHELVLTLQQGMELLRTHVEASERRLRGLGDRSQEIASLIGTIAAIASRTDLLALNASIESLRAGEHGRGFAVVAEEVRKLSEQAAEATREAAGLVESAQLETSESVAVLSRQRNEVEQEIRRVGSAVRSLQQMLAMCDESASRVGQISQGSQHQLRLTRDLVVAVETISHVAKSGRSQAEKACWTTKTLTEITEDFNAVLEPLRQCAGNRFTADTRHRDQRPAELDERRPRDMMPPAAEIESERNRSALKDQLELSPAE